MCLTVAIQHVGFSLRSGVLFQRAILMSGTSVAPWAVARQAARSSMLVAEATNCSAQSSRKVSNPPTYTPIYRANYPFVTDPIRFSGMKGSAFSQLNTSLWCDVSRELAGIYKM
jgi:hypothetical protein